jgi:membrane protein DedA with SNARE-associated domain
MIGLEPVLARYGVGVIFLGCLLEGETIALLGGMMAHRGLFSLMEAMLAAFFGSLASDQLLFWIGRYRRDWVMRQKLARSPAFTRALCLIERKPRSSILTFRFIYGMRTVSPLALGASRVSANLYALLNAAAAAIWAVLLTGAGYLAWHAIEHVIGRVRSIEHFLLGAVLAAALIVVARSHVLDGIRRNSKLPNKLD